MIVAFNLDSTHHMVVDMDTTSGSTSLANSTRKGGLGTMFKVSEETVTSEADMVHAAPLVFPPTDKEHTNGAGEDHGGKMQHAGKFFSGYLDRRVQAKYAAEHGADSALTIPGALDDDRFASKFSNPNHPASSGNLRALLPVGDSSSQNKTPEGAKSSNAPVPLAPYGSSGYSEDDQAAMRDQHAPSSNEPAPPASYRTSVGSYEGQGVPQDKRRLENCSPIAGIKKFLKPGVLYLLIAEIAPMTV